MASAIASVPVLTGQAAEKFEAQAKKTYDEYLKRRSCPKDKSIHYEHGVQMVKSILEKSALKGI